MQKPQNKSKNHITAPSFLYTWRRAVQKLSKLPFTTRGLLLSLSLYMNENGGNCFPSVRLLADDTGLTTRSVVSHVDLSVEKGWLQKFSRGKNGQGWRRLQYQASMPPIDEVLNLIQHVTENGIPEQSRMVLNLFQHLTRKRVEPGSEGVEPNSTNVLNDVQTSISGTQQEFLKYPLPPAGGGISGTAAPYPTSSYEKKPTDFLLRIFDGAKSKFKFLNPAHPVDEYFNKQDPEDDWLTVDDFVCLATVLESRGQDVKEVTSSKKFQNYLAKI